MLSLGFREQGGQHDGAAFPGNDDQRPAFSGVGEDAGGGWVGSWQWQSRTMDQMPPYASAAFLIAR